jgi:hypothetical protein
MTVKEHYDQHLGNFYAWMSGDFTEKQREQKNFFLSQGILPAASKTAFDLGAGHGLQSVALAQLGFSVKAVDFNHQLILALQQNKGNLDIAIIEDDLIQFLKKTNEKASLIVCMGDTLTHLEDLSAVKTLFFQIEHHLLPQGKVVLSFRDLTGELTATQRFLPVKSDPEKIHTCFLEYFSDKVMVYDILHEKSGDTWTQKVSAYPKLRLNEKVVTAMLAAQGLNVVSSTVNQRLIYLVAEKQVGS